MIFKNSTKWHELIMTVLRIREAYNFGQERRKVSSLNTLFLSKCILLLKKC